MSDTFFTAPPHWTWWIVPYFFIGGIAGGSYFIAALMDWLGRPEDRTVARYGYYVAALGAMVSAVLLILDLERPERFWHMIFQSERFPLPAFKGWSPISFGSWGLLLFGGFATASALAALADEGRIRWRWPLLLRRGALGAAIAMVGALLGFFVAGYTGILLSVTNRPIWADSQLVGALFLLSGASTAAASLVLLGTWRRGSRATVAWLSDFDSWLLVLELLVLVVFLVSLGRVIAAWLNLWGVVLLVGVVFAGIALPLALHWRPAWFRRWTMRPKLTAAVLVLVGGFLLRLSVILASERIMLFPFSESS